MYIKFNDGTQFPVPNTVPVKLTQEILFGHKREVLTVKVEGEHSAVKAAFNGQPWAIADGEAEYDKSNYTLVASICDNMDGTITVRVGRKNTSEETLQDEKNALAAEKAALAAENAEQAEVINILAGGA